MPGLDVNTAHNTISGLTGASSSMRSPSGDELSVGTSSSITWTVSAVGALDKAGIECVGDVLRRFVLGSVFPYIFQE